MAAPEERQPRHACSCQTARLLSRSLRASRWPVRRIKPGSWRQHGRPDRPGKQGYGSVSGSWTEPGISCAAGENSEDAFWVGIDGYNGSTVEQAGTEAECNNGHPFYDTWWEMFPSGPVIVGTSLAPGDTIHASVTRSGSTYTLSVTDTNAPPDSFSVPFTRGGEANATAEWIAEGSTNQLSDFHRWVLSDAVVDGGVISSHPDNEVTMTDSSGAVEAQPTALNSADNGFTVFWVRGT